MPKKTRLERRVFVLLLHYYNVRLELRVHAAAGARKVFFLACWWRASPTGNHVTRCCSRSERSRGSRRRQYNVTRQTCAGREVLRRYGNDTSSAGSNCCHIFGLIAQRSTHFTTPGIGGWQRGGGLVGLCHCSATRRSRQNDFRHLGANGIILVSR